jgi:nucleoside-diphosphate-sugar epimerase
MKVIAITGGNGFIGRHLVRRHVDGGDRVRVLTRRAEVPHGAERFAGDLANIPRAVVDGADVLYHCAGEIRDAEAMHRVHVDGTRALLDAAAGNIGRWVQLSSVGAYGARREGVVRETDELRPVGPYERTKAESDALVEARGIPYTILRPSIVFGADMPNQSLRQLVRMIDRRLFFYIGRPGASANYIHVERVVDALQLCATHEAALGEVFNLSDYLTLEEFVNAIAAALGRSEPKLRLPEWPVRLAARIPKLPLTQPRIDALTTRASYPATKIVTRLGYRPSVSLRESLIAFVREMHA